VGNNSIKTINKAFKTTINVNPLLIELFKQFSGNRRFIYNQLLNILDNAAKSNIKKIAYSTKKNKPTLKQQEKLLANYDKLSDDKKPSYSSLYNDNNISIYSKKGLQNILTTLQDDYDFLGYSHSQMNQESAHALSKAYTNFLSNKPSLKNSGKPNFKKKHNINSFYLPNQDNIFLDLSSKEIYIKPLQRFVEAKLDSTKNHKDKKLYKNFSKIFIPNKTKIPKEFFDSTSKKNLKITGITISIDRYNNVSCSINYKYEKIIKKQFTEKEILNTIKNNRVIGIDIGLKNKTIDNVGNKFKSIIDNKTYKKLEVEQKKLKRKLSKKVEYNKEKLLKVKLINKIIKSNPKKFSKNKYKNYSKSERNLFFNSKEGISAQKSTSITKKRMNKVIKLSKKKNNKYLKNQNNINYALSFPNVLKTDHRFTKGEWKIIYNDLNIKKLTKNISKLETKLTNIRNDENHKLSSYIVDNYDYIFMEDLTLKGMQKLWGNKIKKLQLGKLIKMIKYKAKNQGKVFIQINKWFPSTKSCSNCGNVKTKDEISLKDRTYHCNECDFIEDRDINAAINILKEGIRTYLLSIQNENNSKNNIILELNKENKDLMKRITSALSPLMVNSVNVI